MVALLFHDIGYIKNILEEDNSDGQWVSESGDRLKIKETDTDAVLTNFHVYRGEKFSRYYLKNYKNIDAETVSNFISGTTFPIPEAYDDDEYNRLVQAADSLARWQTSITCRKQQLFLMNLKKIMHWKKQVSALHWT